MYYNAIGTNLQYIFQKLQDDQGQDARKWQCLIETLNIMEKMLILHMHTLTAFGKTNSRGLSENLSNFKWREFFQVAALWSHTVE